MRNRYIDLNRVLIAFFLLAGFGFLSAQADIQGDIRSVGFGGFIRTGMWIPVRVELGLQNQVSFDGKLRLRERDADGDYITHEIPVHLQADSGPQRSYWLYTIFSSKENIYDLSVNLFSTNDYAIPIRDSSGEPQNTLTTSSQLRSLSDTDYLILVLTPADRTAGRISRLSAPDQASRFWKTIHIAHITPEGLPSLPAALEAVDCIVWEDANADKLNRAQQETLIQWIFQGGHLFIASSTSADTLMSSDLIEPILPVRTGKLQSVSYLENFWETMLQLPDGVFPNKAVGVVPGSLKSGARVLLSEPSLAEDENSGADVLVARNTIGNGMVTWQGITTQDALQYGGGIPAYFGRVLALRTSQSIPDEGMSSTHPLFPAVQNTIGFSQVGGLYLVIAFMFALIYVAVSTFGTWGVLKSRRKLHYNWLVFASVALAASFLSIVGVQYVRGFGQKLHQLSVVDLEIGKAEASATSWFGVKTGTHTQLDIWLPEDRNNITEPELSRKTSLKPLVSVENQHGSTSTFTDPTEYRLKPTESELNGVPFRATIKQFTGTWRGALPIGVSSKIRIENNQVKFSNASSPEEDAQYRRVDMIASGSTVTNNLGFNLVDCYLLQAAEDAFRGKRLNCFSPRGSDAVRMAYAHPIGVIKQGETLDLAKRIYTNNGKAKPAREWMDKHSLHSAMKNWARPFRRDFTFGTSGSQKFSTTDYQKALLLTTLLNEYPQTILAGTYGGYTQLTAELCSHLDLSDSLSKQSLILVGFATDPGPVTLCTRSTGDDEYEPLSPSVAHTMYRIVIPVSN